jgi:cytochrome c oxidase assembly protein subunit 20
MAGDTRDGTHSPPRGPPPGVNEPPEHVKTPNKVYEVFSAPPSANALPEGSGQNTAGGHEATPSLTEAIKTVRLGDFKQVHMYPCVRESLLMGIGGGFGIGGIRALWGCTVIPLHDKRLWKFNC